MIWSKTINLQLGCMYYMALKYHMEEALKEKNLNSNMAVCQPPVALFSKKYCEDIDKLDHTKIYDYCFIGSINTNPVARQWVIEFAKKNFTNNSIFINTDNTPDWNKLGSFDHSNENLGYCPKSMPNNQSKNVQYRVVSENIFYFETMCQSKFVLCPAGDAPWSFRFYETLMCKSIPVVESWHHTYRTPQESKINYKYILSTSESWPDSSTDYYQYINHNSNIFYKCHMLH